MLDNNLYSSLQSEYKERHFTETALFKVQSDIMTALDSGLGAVLDMSAAFDTIDHGILLSRLNSLYGISVTNINIVKQRTKNSLLTYTHHYNFSTRPNSQNLHLK